MKPIEKISKTQFKSSLFTSFLMFILLGVFTVVAINSVQIINNNKKENEWNYILSVLYENQSKAEIQVNDIKDNVVKDTDRIYLNNKEKLNYDMENLDVNNQFMVALDNNIRGKFININNDNNDVLVISTWQKNDNIDLPGKIIYDKSINCMSNGEMRTFDIELSGTVNVTGHYNYELGYNGLKKIITQNKSKPIIWEYLKSSNPNHIMLKEGSYEGLKEVFMAEGIEGLKTYEVLVQSNIMDNGDLLGNTKVQNNGLYNNDNRQIIIIQGFSLYDALMSNKHDMNLLSIDKTYDTDLKLTYSASGFLIVLIIVIFSTTIKLLNMSADIEDFILKIMKIDKISKEINEVEKELD